MRAAGCVTRGDTIVPRGTIGLFAPDGSIERFDCTGVTGAEIRLAVSNHADQFFAANPGRGNISTGYFIRHYMHSIEYCGTTTFKYYQGSVLLDEWTVWNNNCVTVHYFWDEYVPAEGDDSDEIPWNPAGNGGPAYFGPDDPLNREPTIDTVVKKDHQCPDTEADSIANDLRCRQNLTTLDSLWLWDSVRSFFKDTSLIADTADRRMCAQMLAWYEQALLVHIDNSEITEGRASFFYRGRDNSEGPFGSHNASTRGVRDTTGTDNFINWIHFDPRLLDSIQTAPQGPHKFARAVLHEVAHGIGGIDHPPISNPPQGYAGWPYFETLELNNACVI